jgi:hypothetical protein
MLQTNLSLQNQRELRKLSLSIRANVQRLDLFIAVCDDRNLQAQLIDQYEADYHQAGIATYRTRFDPEQPSLKAALEKLVTQKPALQTGEKAVVTVLGAATCWASACLMATTTNQNRKGYFSPCNGPGKPCGTLPSR